MTDGVHGSIINAIKGVYSYHALMGVASCCMVGMPSPAQGKLRRSPGHIATSGLLQNVTLG